jgi:hypothetical protein
VDYTNPFVKKIKGDSIKMEKSLMKKKTKKMVYKKGRTVRMKVRPVDRIDYEKLAKNITVM